MREPKFRAWDITAKEMCELISLDLGQKPRARTYKEFLCDGEFELMQFTGFKDKNGVEIYEGDILKDDKIYATVEWDNAGARFYSKKATNQAWVNCEVVGNVYEGRKKGWLSI